MFHHWPQMQKQVLATGNSSIISLHFTFCRFLDRMHLATRRFTPHIILRYEQYLQPILK